MQNSADATVEGNSDLFFKCENCGTALVVDVAGAGMTLKCQRCGAPTTVPHPFSPGTSSRPAPSPERRLELQHHLKENESQHTEIKGYIHQLSIQLHRWQLRLQDLEKRNRELTEELAGVQSNENETPVR